LGKSSDLNSNPRASKRRPYLLETQGIENRRFRWLSGIRLWAHNQTSGLPLYVQSDIIRRYFPQPSLTARSGSR
jgi:hypothetical protein